MHNTVCSQQRLFIAYYPPIKLIEQIFSEVGKAKNGRLVEKLQTHLTLLFMGEINTEVIPTLIKQLDIICQNQQAFNVETLGFRYLPANNNPRLLALSCRLGPELAALHHQCQSLLIDQDKKRKPFLPHITICRYKRKPGKLIIPDHQTTSFNVCEIKLMRSELLPNRAAHYCLESFELN